MIWGLILGKIQKRKLPSNGWKIYQYRSILLFMFFVTTLALSSWPKQRGCKGAGQEEAQESHHTLRECGKCEGVNLHTPKATPTLGDGVPGPPETSENDLKGQNSIACGVPYIIRNLLERRHLKWARIAHLHIWNTSYDQKKGRESNCQFNSRPEKVENQPDLLGCR